MLNVDLKIISMLGMRQDGLAPELALTIVAESARSIVKPPTPFLLRFSWRMIFSTHHFFGLENTGSLVYAWRGNISLAGIRLQGMMDIC
jgi:hypothetical protein